VEPWFKLVVEPASHLYVVFNSSGAFNTYWVEAFFNHTHDIITMVPILLGTACYYTGSLEVMKQVLTVEGKTHLIKPKDLLLSVLYVATIF
jgi:hypothetical protein